MMQRPFNWGNPPGGGGGDSPEGTHQSPPPGYRVRSTQQRAGEGDGEYEGEGEDKGEDGDQGYRCGFGVGVSCAAAARFFCAREPRL